MDRKDIVRGEGSIWVETGGGDVTPRKGSGGGTSECWIVR